MPFKKGHKINVGRKMSKEQKLKISKSQLGKNNSMYGKIPWNKGKPHKQGKDNYFWKGGRINMNGYVYIHSPNHPCVSKLGYVFEHRLVMEAHLGRTLLSTEVVHHINGIRDDNRIQNLILFDSISKHLKHHAKEKKHARYKN